MLFGLLGLAAFVAAFLTAPVGSVIIALLADITGVHLALRDHPGLSSGPGTVIAIMAITVLAATQVVVIWPAARKSAIVAVALATVAGVGGSVLVTARDVDATTSTALSAVTVKEQHGPLSGITAVDAKNGAERWHHWERDWTDAQAGLSPDGATAYLAVDKTTGRYALAFAAATGKLLWQKELRADPGTGRLRGPPPPG
ncbi:hypothetical protein [Kutzneria kofuensis]|uniref:hypothetical protein n=1 Tax=Kutzneria kofuensis TaxID=103725 RepID=UPI0031E53A29